MKAGFPTIQDRSIKDKVLGLDKEWMKLNKHAKREDERFRKNCDEFSSKIDSLFNIAPKDIENILGVVFFSTKFITILRIFLEFINFKRINFLFL